MPRFYFHMRQGARLVIDEEGMELPSQGHARAQALQSARELWADAIKGVEIWVSMPSSSLTTKAATPCW
jgi:Domain of unknown function (DUF6894)